MDVLTSHNFILIHSIKEIEENGVKKRQVATLGRTDYDSESDFLSMKAGIFNAFPEAYQPSKIIDNE